MIIGSESLIGERAKLIPLDISHAEELFEAGNFPEIWTYMPQRVVGLDEMKAMVESAITQRELGTEFPYCIVDQANGKILGSTRFMDISEANRNLEIGYTWLTPEVWRSRINTECKYLLLKHCFEVVGTIRVQLKTDARNLRSQAAIERIGGVREGVLRKHRILWDGYIRDSVYYSVLEDEWPHVKANLEAMLQR